MTLRATSRSCFVPLCVSRGRFVSSGQAGYGSFERKPLTPGAGERRVAPHDDVEGGERRAGGESGGERLDILAGTADERARPGGRKAGKVGAGGAT